jgi:membrane-anchored mycosin MYCP
MKRRILCGTAAAAIALLSAAPAAAMPQADPEAIPSISPEDPVPAPVWPMEQKSECAAAVSLPNSVWDRQPPAHASFEVDRLREFGDGAGITVAVIGTGVAPNVRLPRLQGGGDYIEGGDGLQDCDATSSLVASMIGGQGHPDDGFEGVAPGVNLISIRTTSYAYGPVTSAGEEPQLEPATTTLAKAIVHAANLGAKVINVAQPICGPAALAAQSPDLAIALKYAVEQRGAVVVAGAGNTFDEACAANPGYNPANAGDPRNWEAATAVSLPSYYTPYVLSVGGATVTGDVHPETASGPWISVAAPAYGFMALDPGRGDVGALINAAQGSEGAVPLSGNAFSSAYVTGLVAIMRQLKPELGPQEIMDRIVSTARAGGEETRNLVGSGVVDAVSALTFETAGAAPGIPSPSVEHVVPIVEDESRSAELIIASVVLFVCVVGAMSAVTGRALATRRQSAELALQDRRVRAESRRINV